MTASGGRIAAAASAPPRCRPSRPRSRRRAGSCRAPAGSAARRRRRERAARSRGNLPAAGEREAPARTWRPGRRATRPRCGRRSPRRTRARSRGRVPRRAVPRRSRAGRARRCARARRRRHPGPRSTTRTSTSLEVALTCTRTGSAGGEYLSAFSIRFASTRWICRRRRGRAATSGRDDLHAPPASPSSSSACTMISSTSQTSGRARQRPPAAGRGRGGCRRDGRDDRTPRIVSSSSARSAASSRGRRARAPRPRSDRHQRRAQVVADGAEQRGLHRVAAPQRLGLERLAPSRSRSIATPSSDASAGSSRRRAAALPAPRRRVDRPQRASADLSAMRVWRRPPPPAGPSAIRALDLEHVGRLGCDPLQLGLTLPCSSSEVAIRPAARSHSRYPSLPAPERAASSLTTTAVDDEDGEREPVRASRPA